MKGVIKGSILFLFFSMLNVIGYGQAPDLISYQAIIRNSNNELVSERTVGMRISILRGSEANVLLYQEEHNVKTNLNGLIYLNIGSGTPLFGIMSGIDWSKGPFYIKSETDPNGGKNYTLIVVSQLLSVPFSIYAKSAEKVTGPLSELDPLFSTSISKGITAIDTAYWNKKLSSFTESDPLFSASISRGITAVDTAYWNKKLSSFTESDPFFSASISKGITAVDTAYWNKKLSSFTESDPLFNASIAKGITAADTALWNTESDPIFGASVAKGITAADTALWNTETDPLYNASVAKGITAVDTASWNQKVGLPQTGNTAGDILYWNGTAWVKIQTGLPGQGLFLSQTGVPMWAGPSFATLTTNAVTSVTNISAISGGNITSDGESPITARGICWSTSPNPTVANDSTRNGVGAGFFTSNISGLLGSTTYYVRAYAINTKGIAYGNQITFTTPAPTPPSLTTTAVSSITSVSVATGGTVVNNGGAPITARGVVWDTLTNPLVSKNRSINGSVNNIFLDTIRGLAGSRVYYVRSYATNSAGTAYGNQLSFTTLAPVVPTVTINPIDLITNVSARSGGAITSDGGAAILSKGVVWSTFPNPTISNSKTTDSSGVAPFTSQLTGLLGDSVYYVRAYATNATGTGYSSQLNFTAAPAVLATITTSPITSVTSNSANSGGNVTSNGGGVISARGVVWNTSPMPTLSHFKTTDGSGTGVFTSNLTSLNPPGTTFYVRAYVTNSAGTNYGNEISFTTLAVAPTLTTKPITSITSTSATSGGIITTDGGSVLTERGLVYGTTTNPTILSNKLVGSLAGTDWSSTITGLIGNTKYYVRAFATNSIGTSYGNLDSLVTLPVVPTLTTNNIISITDSSAISGGNIASDGGAAITDRGIVWGLSQNPTLPSADTTKNGIGTGLFTSNLRGLNGSTTYYVRAYATNSAGTGYGNQVSFTTLPVIIDASNNRYSSIVINGLEWLTTNLKTTKYANGDSISNVVIDGSWGLSNSGAWSFYNNDPSNDVTYGKLYNWYAVNDPRGLCPSGWHVATENNWQSLVTPFGGYGAAANELKTTTTWTLPNSNTNTSGFSALPGGGRASGGNFADINNRGGWWTSSTSGPIISKYISMIFNSDSVGLFDIDIKSGFSVRCVKD